jgi:hypothetical protein
MVVIYAAQHSPRLQYITSFIFKDLLHTPIQITNGLQAFNSFAGIKICYDQNQQNGIRIIAANNILFKTSIIPQQIEVGQLDGFETLFSIETEASTAFPFDIFAASF